MTPVIAISTTTDFNGEYAAAVRAAGGAPRLLQFDPATIDSQLDGAGGVVLSGGGDVDPTRYGAVTELAAEVDQVRDAFELALVARARERGLPTLCICRGLQVANVAFGGTLLPDIETALGAATATLHRLEVAGTAERGIIAGHDIDLAPDAVLTSIVGSTRIATGSRHHQSLARIAPDLRVVATTADGIVEAAEARFASPFWLGVQWHPESTALLGDAPSSAIFAAFIVAAGRFAHEGVLIDG